ncbi:hypothetical protein [Rhodococcus phenolicus]|uniref:hypothetical protein n=1 Tax=Rhodococcus phenolicus TaxID=263849 RepID=UPI001FDF55DE|nr:hypothetical protein [Rhodococcus phenolicus]
MAGDENAVAAAWLHDVVEGTPVTLVDLEESFPAEVTTAVDALTRRPRPAYREDRCGPQVRSAHRLPRDLDRRWSLRCGDRPHRLNREQERRARSHYGRHAISNRVGQVDRRCLDHAVSTRAACLGLSDVVGHGERRRDGKKDDMAAMTTSLRGRVKNTGLPKATRFSRCWRPSTAYRLSMRDSRRTVPRDAST